MHEITKVNAIIIAIINKIIIANIKSIITIPGMLHQILHPFC